MSDDVAQVKKVPSTYDKLAARFPTEDHAKVNKGGGDQTYVPAEKIISRLNDVLGVGGWSFSVLREGFTGDETWVLGEITATIDDQVVTRQQYGDQALTVGRGDREKPVSDLMKKAGTNALKKCATLLGVALYLCDEDERHEVEAEMAAAKREASRPAQKPTPIDQERLDLVARLEKGIAYAQSIGLEPAGIDVVKLAKAEIEETIDALRMQCQLVLADRKKKGALAS